MAESTRTGRVVKVLYADDAKPFVLFELADDDGPVVVAAQAAGVAPGQQVRVTGDFRDHPKYGDRKSVV